MDLLIKQTKSQLRLKKRVSGLNNIVIGPVFFVALLSLMIGTKLSPIDEANPNAGLAESVKLVAVKLFFNQQVSEGKD